MSHGVMGLALVVAVVTGIVDCALRRFVLRNAYRTTVPRDLLQALRTEFPNAESKLRARGARF